MWPPTGQLPGWLGHLSKLDLRTKRVKKGHFRVKSGIFEVKTGHCESISQLHARYCGVLDRKVDRFWVPLWTHYGLKVINSEGRLNPSRGEHVMLRICARRLEKSVNLTPACAGEAPIRHLDAPHAKELLRGRQKCVKVCKSGTRGCESDASVCRRGTWEVLLSRAACERPYGPL